MLSLPALPRVAPVRWSVELWKPWERVRSAALFLRTTGNAAIGAIGTVTQTATLNGPARDQR